MIKHILILWLFLSIPSITHAWQEEEKECFTLLNKAVQEDNRYNNSSTSEILVNWDLTEVLYDESTNSFKDLSTYENFSSAMAVNPVPKTALQISEWLTHTDFLARRNNIWTIVASWNYVISNIVGFWKDSNFDFPLTPNNPANSYWDAYKFDGGVFREYVAYTHHNYEWDFMSCGIVKINPLSGKNFSNISESGYKTNILNWESCGSWFEWNKVTSLSGKEFYKLKSNVCVSDYENKDYVKMEVISVAYNNASTYMNEYLTHQLQVKAMDDLWNSAVWWLKAIWETFRDYVYNQTCLSLIHPTTSTLPSACAWAYWDDFVFNKVESRSLLSFIFPSAEAKREWLKLSQEVEQSKWMVVYEDFPYELYQKLNSIEDETLKSYLLLSIVPNLEEMIMHRKQNDILISPYEETFLACGIKYSERSEILQSFIKNITDVSEINLENLSYANPKFWDCIVPYPDKKNLKTEIAWSFPSNRILAQKLNGTYKYEEVPEEMKKFLEDSKKLEADYSKKMNSLLEKFNWWSLTTDEYNKAIAEEKKSFEEDQNVINNIKEPVIDKAVPDVIAKEAESLNSAWFATTIDNSKAPEKSYTILAIIILFLVGAWILVFMFTKTKKTES